jgi:hypothetical protein
MRAGFRCVFLLTAAVLLTLGCVTGASAQYRVQETPALNGLGMLIFKDVEFRVDGGRGNTAGTLFLDPATSTQQTRSQWYWGIFIDKPIIGQFLEMAYDTELFGQRDWVPRDTWYRDLFFEAIRLEASYRDGRFHVSGQNRDTEFYVGGRYSLDLGRIARHIPIFQK